MGVESVGLDARDSLVTWPETASRVPGQKTTSGGDVAPAEGGEPIDSWALRRDLPPHARRRGASRVDTLALSTA